MRLEDVDAQGREEEAHVVEKRLHVGLVGLGQPPADSALAVGHLGALALLDLADEPRFEPAHVSLGKVLVFRDEEDDRGPEVLLGVMVRDARPHVVTFADVDGKSGGGDLRWPDEDVDAGPPNLVALCELREVGPGAHQRESGPVADLGGTHPLRGPINEEHAEGSAGHRSGLHGGRAYALPGALGRASRAAALEDVVAAFAHADPGGVHREMRRLARSTTCPDLTRRPQNAPWIRKRLRRGVPVADAPASVIPDAPELSAGSLVRVRQRTYLVQDVKTAPGTSAVVQLACVDDDAAGQRLDVIWDAEVDAKIIPPGRSALKPNIQPDDPKTFAAYLHALRWGCVTSTDPSLFQAPLRAGIVPKSYQLEPLRKALALPRVNLFIADDVGLGKTIEAGLVLQELLLRQRVNRVVVACPSSVVLQWRDELLQRFGLSFVVFDKAYINARRRERGFGINAWTTHRHFIISHALLRDEDYLVGLRGWLGDFAPGSLLILDEAHAAAPSSESKYAIDSQTTRAARDVAKRFEHRLFLSATPHNGHSNSFSALLEILDPQRFTRGVPVRPSALKPVMVRRLKGELRKHVGSQIPERRTIQIDLKDLPEGTPELVLASMLAEYTDILERRLAGSSNRTKAAGKLVTVALQKRLLSSVEAFARTLAVHRRNAGKTAPTPSAQAPSSTSPQVGFLDDAGETDDDLTEEQAAELDEVGVARATKAGASAEDDARAKKLLDEMTAIADGARDLPDAKAHRKIT
jgi:SNF2-related domain